MIVTLTQFKTIQIIGLFLLTKLDNKKVDKKDIIAHHNNDKCINFKRNYINGYFSGLKWQCVEFARRYLIVSDKISFQEIETAEDIFRLNYFFNLSDNTLISINKYVNGSMVLPHVGSLLIWSKSKELKFADNSKGIIQPSLDKDANQLYLKYGHVAIITSINPKYIVIREQNWDIKNNRKLKLKYKNGYYIIEKDIIGWINYN